MSYRPPPSAPPADPRTGEFTRILLVAWFVWPLGLGIAGLLWGGFAPPFEVEEPVWAVPAITAGAGVLLGSLIALIQTLRAYHRLYRKG